RRKSLELPIPHRQKCKHRKISNPHSSVQVNVPRRRSTHKAVSYHPTAPGPSVAAPIMTEQRKPKTHPSTERRGYCSQHQDSWPHDRVGSWRVGRVNYLERELLSN